MRRFIPFAALVVTLGTTGRASAETKRFALAVFHFNLQYVAGGLLGMGGPASDKTEAEIEDRIVTETFEPVLDLFLAHPNWGQDIELQGYMLEVLAARHPTVLEKLRTLADRKQIDVVSFHYSDQLFIAYPNVDLERSQSINAAVFAGAAIPLSTSVFCQEGQLGLGIAEALPQRGYKTLIWSKNNFAYQHPGQKPAALYRIGDARIVTTDPAVTTVNGDTVEATWTFVDDGELLATGGANPYFNFTKKPEAVAAYEKQLADLEAQGFVVTPVARYVEALEKVTPGEPPPPLLDGTWQPQSTNATYKWMGGRAIFGADERDNEVRSLGAIAHRELVLAETAARASNLEVQAELASGWRLLALGQVSDASGITPIRGEVEYGLAHLTEALRIARAVITRAKATAGAQLVSIDSMTGTMTAVASNTEAEPPYVERGPVELEVTAADRNVRVRWQSPEPDHWIASVEIPPGDGFRVAVTVPGVMGDIFYTPSMSNTPARLSRSAFGFETYWLPLNDGLIGLGSGRYLVKDMSTLHLAARVTPASGDITFSDETVPLEESITWKMHIVERDEASAVALAKSLNVTPRGIR